MVYAGETFTFTHRGVGFVATVEHDSDHGAPWEEEEGHGPVSEWTTRDKQPGELVLAQDGQLFRYYDFAEACEIAKRDGWDAKPHNTGQETKAQQAAKAARADYEHLRRWCDDDWQYVGVVVRRADACPCCGKSESVWGIDSDSGDYIREVACVIAERLLG